MFAKSVFPVLKGYLLIVHEDPSHSKYITVLTNNKSY